MLSIGDEQTRTLYKDAVEAAIPGVTVVPEPEMVAEYFRLLARTVQLELGTNNVILVVGFLETQHRKHICFSRDSGCCLQPEFLLPDGSLTDVYFMLRAAGVEPRVRAMQTDLWNALVVSCEMAQGDLPLLVGVLELATIRYTRTETLAGDVRGLIDSAARAITNEDSAGLQALVNAVLMRSGST